MEHIYQDAQVPDTVEVSIQHWELSLPGNVCKAAAVCCVSELAPLLGGSVDDSLQGCLGASAVAVQTILTDSLLK